MTPSPWATRRARAAALLREAPHAEEILVFYIGLTEIQEQTADRVGASPIAAALPPVEADGYRLSPASLPLGELGSDFEYFLLRIRDVGTDSIASAAQALLDAGPAARRAALVEADAFCSRAFLDPVLTVLDIGEPRSPTTRNPSGCPACGASPVVAVLRDLPESLGHRSLVCSLCSTEWRFDRLRCARCAESDGEQLVVHSAESVPHVRVDECRACAHYIKTVDLRERGDAVPVVDELATVELDLWARERGLTKIQRNVLEL